MRIDSTCFGSIIVRGRKYESDVIIFWDGEIIEREKSHNFSKGELQDILLKEPEIVVVGTGQSGLMKVDESAEILAGLEGVKIVAKPTPQAIEEFNKLSGKKVAGIFHVTC